VKDSVFEYHVDKDFEQDIENFMESVFSILGHTS